jgi:excisionase family DNA binding protein
MTREEFEKDSGFRVASSCMFCGWNRCAILPGPYGMSSWYFTDAEVAEIAGKNRQTISRWRREGYLEAARFGRRSVMFRRAEVERLVRGEIDFSRPPRKKGE